MKRIKTICCALAVLLALTLGAGCAATPQHDNSTPPQADAAQSAQTQENTNAAATPAGPLRELLPTNYTVGTYTQQFFYGTSIILGDQHFATYMDMAEKKQLYLCDVAGCAHGTQTCGALLDMSTSLEGQLLPWFATEDTLYWAQGGDMQPFTVYTSAPDGTGKEMLFTAEGEELAYTPDEGVSRTEYSRKIISGAVYTDGAALYLQFLAHEPSADAITGIVPCLEILRVNLADKTTETIYKSEPDNEFAGGFDRNQLVGCTQDAFLLDIGTFDWTEEPDGIERYQNSLRHQIVLLPKAGAPSDAPLPVVHTYNETDYGAKWFSGGVMYTADPEFTRIQAMDLTTGETRVLVEQLPEANNLHFMGVLDEKMLFTLYLKENPDEGQGYAVNLTDGTLQPLALRHSFKMGTAIQPIMPRAVYQDDYLVLFEERQYVYTGVDQAGTAFSHDSSYDLYALISKADYYAGNPNYREIEMLPQGDAQ